MSLTSGRSPSPRGLPMAAPSTGRDAKSVPQDSAATSTLEQLKTIAALARCIARPTEDDDGAAGRRLAMGAADAHRQDRRRAIRRRLSRLGAAAAAPGRAQAAARVSAGLGRIVDTRHRGSAPARAGAASERPDRVRRGDASTGRSASGRSSSRAARSSAIVAERGPLPARRSRRASASICAARSRPCTRPDCSIATSRRRTSCAKPAGGSC